jgi:hypothetical protein
MATKKEGRDKNTEAKESMMKLIYLFDAYDRKEMQTEKNKVIPRAGIEIKKVVKVPNAYNAYISLPSLSHPRG